MKKYFLILSLTVFASACLPTLHPLYKSKDLMVLDGLTGNWKMQSKDKPYLWNFTPNPDAKSEDDFKNLYRIQIIDKNDTVEYAGGILKLGASVYLDLYMPNFETKLPFAQSHIFPVHTIWKFEFHPDSILIKPFNSRWIRELVANNQVRIKHEQADAGTLITAGTDELQQFVKKYGEDDRAFDKPHNLIKE